jgi:hypothetical protein
MPTPGPEPEPEPEPAELTGMAWLKEQRRQEAAADRKTRRAAVKQGRGGARRPGSAPPRRVASGGLAGDWSSGRPNKRGGSRFVQVGGLGVTPLRVLLQEGSKAVAIGWCGRPCSQA